MNTFLKILVLFILVFLLGTNPVWADKYPKNPNIDILHYKFELVLSDDTDEIKGVTTINILFKKDGIDKLRLDLVNTKDSLKGKGMIIESIYEKGNKVNYTHADNEVWITFSETSSANTETQIVIRYHGIPGDALRIGPTRYGDRSFFNENWPNRARNWLPTIDHPYEKATSEFIVRAPAQYQVISNGLLVEETNIDAKTKLTHWKQSVPVSSWLYVLGVAQFAVQYVDWFEGKSIQTWVYPRDRDAGFYDFAEPTRQVVGYFSDYVGPYAYEKIANVQTPSVKGGMETSSAIFYGEELVNGKRNTRTRNVVIHELAHQWFGNAVTESTWDDAWLSEGFATFFTLLFIEHAYGREEFVSGLLNAKKMVYDYYAKDPSYSVVGERTAENGPVTNYSITYQKGAWVLHMLRDLMGDADFKKGIQSYYKRYMNANATTDDFRIEMEKASGLDLKSFFTQWLYRSENITLKGTWKYDKEKKQVMVKVNQSQVNEYLFDVPVEFGVYNKGSILPEIFKFRVNSKMASFSIPVTGKPDKIVFDPRIALLAMVDFTEEK